jgi:hypothetical protein
MRPPVTGQRNLAAPVSGDASVAVSPREAIRAGSLAAPLLVRAWPLPASGICTTRGPRLVAAGVRDGAGSGARSAPAPIPWPGTCSTVPARTLVGSEMPLARCRSASVVPCRRAMA